MSRQHLHLSHHRASQGQSLWLAILASWGIAFFEYTLMVPANRIGYGRFSLPQLKVIQEVITLLVFAVFTVAWMRERLHLNHLWAGLCLVGAVFFTFRR
ncbi:MAG: DMT family protein [Holophagaceae bacterium]|nr:DMT family protein [Holophagaceae bacterium]